MTTARRALTCASCGFSNDDIWHFKNCVPTQYWPAHLRDQKRAAMNQRAAVCECGEPLSAHPIHDGHGWHFATLAHAPERAPERVKTSLHEYRLAHPEANPLTAEQRMVTETRTNLKGEEETFERPKTIREAVNEVQPCTRCGRPLIDRMMHITCQPKDGTIPPPYPPRDVLKRDALPPVTRRPKVHTEADVKVGNAWFEGESGPIGDDAVDEDDPELADFLDPGAGLRAQLQAEAVAEHERRETASEAVHPFTCPDCGRVSKSAAGNAAHQRSHKPKE